MSTTGSEVSREFLNGISDGFITLDGQHRVKFINDAARRLFQLRDLTLGSLLREALPDSLSLELRDCIQKSMASGSETQMEYYYDRPTPSYLQICIVSHDGCSIIQCRNITAQREIEKTIEENQKKLLLLTGAANHMIAHDEPKKILDSLFEELSRYLDLDVYFNYIFHPSKDRLRLMNYSGIDAATADSIEWLEFGQAVCGCVARDRKRIVAEYIEHSDDPRVQLVKGFGIKSYACHPLLSYGQLIGTLSFGSSKRSTFSQSELDLIETICNQAAIALERTLHLTELKGINKMLEQNYQKLLESESKFENIFNAALDSIVLLDSNDIILDANPSACKKLGVTRSTAVNSKYTNLIQIRSLDKEAKEVEVELTGGTVRCFEYTITHDFGMIGHKLIIFRDISEKKKVVQALVDAKELAERTSHAKTEFLTMMSHELRTPLNSVMGFAQILLDDPRQALTEVQQERIAKILRAGRHLSNLVNGMLDHMNVESNKLELCMEKINLPQVVDESIQLIHPMLQTKSISVKVESSPLNVYATGDLTKVKQIILNILTNAVKYNVSHGEIFIKYKVGEDRLVVLIKDTGIGIREEFQKKIFDPFYRIHHPEYNIEGTGMGLAIVNNFVNLMGGEVGLKSKPGKGSCFWFSLPLSS